MNNPKHHSNFRDYKAEQDRKPPTPQEFNFTQLINLLTDFKTELQKVSSGMAEYRLQQMKLVMDMKEHITKLGTERVDIGETMQMILQHLTAPGQLTQYAGAVMPAADAIALQVAELLKRPLLLQKAMDAHPDPVTSDFSTSNEGEKEEVPDASDQEEKINIPQKKTRNTYSERMDQMMLGIMQAQGGEWNTNSLLTAMQGKYPHATFKKNSVATAFTILMNAGTIFRVDRGMYMAKERARG